MFLMKKLINLILISLITVSTAQAQLADGSIAPDFTFTDINGTTQHLYAYLDSGKYVAIDLSATWCHPCWEYHNTRTMDSLYELHDIPGDKKWKVLFIEGDGGTNNADLHGTGGSTQGDWVTGSLFPIIDPPSGTALNDFNTGYSIGFFPTLMLICPNRRIYTDTLNGGSSRPDVNRWEYVAANSSCAVSGINEVSKENTLTIYPNPAQEYVTLSFGLNTATDITLTITNTVGQTIDTHSFGKLPAGKQFLHYDLGKLIDGIYVLSISDNSGLTMRHTVVVQP